MTSIPDLREQLTNLEVPNRGINEPLSAPDLFSKKLQRFPDTIYNLHQDSHLYRFLLAICGEGGAGSIKKEILYSKLQSSIASTHFHDLDRLYGDPLAFPRISLEIYPYDPKGEVLTQPEWTEVYAKDANYRNRCLLWMRAIIYGGSVMGMRLAAEAACGVECDIFEVAEYLDNSRSDHPLTMTNLGQTTSDGEFVIVPRINALTEAEKHRIIAMIDRVRPVDTLVTISLGNIARTQKFATLVSSTSDFSTVQRYVTGRTDINWPDVGRRASRNILQNGGGEIGATTGWSATNGTLTVPNSVIDPKYGTRVFQGVTSGGVCQFYADSIPGEISGTTTGRIWTGSAWVKGTGSTIGKQVWIYVSELLAGGGVRGIGTTIGGVTLTSKWQRVSAYKTFTSANAIGARVYVEPQTLVAGDTFFFDGVQIEESTTNRTVATILASDFILGTSTVMNLTDTSQFDTSGIVLIKGVYVTYSGKTSTTLTGVTSIGSTTVATGATVTQVQSRPTPYIPTATTTNGGPASAINVSNDGSWIVAGEEREAPTFAWINRQEAATFLDVSAVSSSSEHFGQFNKSQRDLFPHLDVVLDDQFFQYADNFAYTNAFAQVAVSIPWMRNDKVIVNNYYPLDYLSVVSIDQFNVSPTHRFWASQEDEAPTNEYLIFDFGRNRPVNYIDFEISQKPVDILVEWSTDGVNYTTVNPNTATDYVFEIAYIVSDQPWRFWRLYFDKVTARYIRLTFIRRTDPFPFHDSDPFPWSVDIRNFRAVHLMQTAEDFQNDTGTDILGNSYRNVLTTFTAGLTNDGLTNTFWQSQPNPTPVAVEALYFDVSTTLHGITMSELDNGIGSSGDPTMNAYDLLSMTNLESYITGAGAQTVDEIFIDPVFSGSDMHFYWSNDTNADWESKLWVPVPIHYKCTRGYHAFPYPVTARYFKIEFSNLTPIPYNTLDYPQLLPPLYRKYPSWVQNYFAALTPAVVQSFLEEGQTVTIDPFDMFKIQQDKLATTRDQQVLQLEEPPDTSTDEVTQIVDSIINVDSTIQTAQEQQIRFFPPTIWQDDLKNVLDMSRAASRIVYQDNDPDTGDQFMIEDTPEILDAPDEQSVTDLSAEVTQKTLPIMWFPRVCRHGYQVVTGPFQAKAAYQVAIREVSFWYRGFVNTSDTTGNSEYGSSTYGGSAYG